MYRATGFDPVVRTPGFSSGPSTHQSTIRPMGDNRAPSPYIGNIIREVCPIIFQVPRVKESRAVNTTSRHQPAMPQRIKFIEKSFRFCLLIALSMTCSLPPDSYFGSIHQFPRYSRGDRSRLHCSFIRIHRLRPA